MIRCVLFIAGDVPFQAAVSPLLARRGYQVEQVGSGEEARALLARERPAFVVLDERLPEGDPLKWVAALREAGDPTPAIILSAAPLDVGAIPAVAVAYRPLLPSVVVEGLEGLGHAGQPASPEENEMKVELAALLHGYTARVPRMLRSFTEAVGACRGQPLATAAGGPEGVTVAHVRELTTFRNVPNCSQYLHIRAARPTRLRCPARQGPRLGECIRNEEAIPRPPGSRRLQTSVG